VKKAKTNHNENGIDAALAKVDVHVGRRRQLQPGRLFKDHSEERRDALFFLQ
jgi:hypothetical protein